MTCPYCDEELRYGVKVCRGCQAEISYEPEPTGFLMFIIGCGIIYGYFEKIENGIIIEMEILDSDFLKARSLKGYTNFKKEIEK